MSIQFYRIMIILTLSLHHVEYLSRQPSMLARLLLFARVGAHAHIRQNALVDNRVIMWYAVSWFYCVYGVLG
jgi:hypothetical protein